MSDQIRDTNFLELLSQQEKTARYLQLLKEAKVAVKRREIHDKQLTVFAVYKHLILAGPLTDANYDLIKNQLQKNGQKQSQVWIKDIILGLIQDDRHSKHLMILFRKKASNCKAL